MLARSPGRERSRCREKRQNGQWLRWRPPWRTAVTNARQWRQRNSSLRLPDHLTSERLRNVLDTFPCASHQRADHAWRAVRAGLSACRWRSAQGPWMTTCFAPDRGHTRPVAVPRYVPCPGVSRARDGAAPVAAAGQSVSGAHHGASWQREPCWRCLATQQCGGGRRPAMGPGMHKSHAAPPFQPAEARSIQTFKG